MGLVSSAVAVSIASMSEYEKEVIACGLPSSVIVNWFAVRPFIGLPDLSVTSTSMRTRSDELRRTADD